MESPYREKTFEGEENFIKEKKAEESDSEEE